MRQLTNDLARFRHTQIDPDPRSIQGGYLIPHPSIQGYFYFCLATNGEGWEHVSISLKKRGLNNSKNRGSMADIERTPTWAEMCWVKKHFWQDDEVVIQIHPAAKDHVSMHPFCLHLWRPTDQVIPLPDPIMVGFNIDEN